MKAGEKEKKTEWKGSKTELWFIRKENRVKIGGKNEKDFSNFISFGVSSHQGLVVQRVK